VIVTYDDLSAYDPQTTYGALALDYDYAQEHYWRFAAERALALGDVGPGMAVLDAACGTGATTLRAAERTRPGGRVMAVDFSPEMLALASEKASRRSLLNIDWRLDDMTTFETPTGSFDVVFCLLALFVVPDMAALATALWRSVRPGGRLVVATVGAPYFDPLYDQFYDAALVEAPALLPPQPWRRTHQAEQLHDVFRAAGVPAAISAETTTVPLREPADWWRIVRATGMSRTVTMLGSEAAARVEAANLRCIDEQGIDELTSCFLYAVAEKE
jgi:ubiquinone/menaquinone biosynthesis C-methylase UbiE